MKKIVRTVFLLALHIAVGRLSAQETWSLEKAVKYALEHNISIRQADATVRTNLLSERSAKALRLPNLSAQVNAGKQFGRTVDPTTNQFNNTGSGFNSLSLNGNLALFQGGLVHHSILQAGYELRASEYSLQQTSDQLALQVAQAYLNILLGEEQQKNAERRVEQSRRQLESTEKLITAGSLPAADRFNQIAQIARDEQTVISARNTVELAYLTFKQLLQIDPEIEVKLETPPSIQPDPSVETYTLTGVFNDAVKTQPAILSGEFRLKAAKEAIAIAKSAYYPSLSIFGSLSSNYSSRFPDISNPTLVGTQRFEQYVTLPPLFPEPTAITFEQPVFSYPTLGYFDQLNDNFGQTVGVTLRVPIYQNNQTRLSVERARLSLANVELQHEQNRQQLKIDIQTAIANVRAGRLQLEAAQRTIDAARTAFSNMERRFAVGATTILEVTTAQNNLTIAENDLAVARYNYLFRLKILDFYLGKPLRLE